MRTERAEGGFSLVEIVLVLVVLAMLGAGLYAYLASTTKTIEGLQQQRPLSQARLAADRATLLSLRGALQMYYAKHGQWPPDRESMVALLSPSPQLQCSGNDFVYDPATGQISLVNDDLARC